jgi:hypothetical protein
MFNVHNLSHAISFKDSLWRRSTELEVVMTNVISVRQEIVRSWNGAGAVCSLVAERIAALASSSFILHG